MTLAWRQAGVVLVLLSSDALLAALVWLAAYELQGTWGRWNDYPCRRLWWSGFSSWQVSGRNHASFIDRVEMDIQFVRDWSVWLDLVLLARTVRALFVDKGAY